ncbi:hypothetical protein SAMN05421507_1522 [Lentzea jiangxiensis]|uniref:Uncharacterized protein n=2 Tax=Lentzea jiangxiensis TaxID=641025 RepID=A0A1H0X8D5_9PSEU|nr:hypothetical protein SAMN05421507_1522 [Lentzea jiangxiensis]
MFISGTLKRWHALFIEEYMAAVAVELVTLSVEQTGGAEVPNPITLRMLGYPSRTPRSCAWSSRAFINVRETGCGRRNPFSVSVISSRMGSRSFRRNLRAPLGRAAVSKCNRSNRPSNLGSCPVVAAVWKIS